MRRTTSLVDGHVEGQSDLLRDSWTTPRRMVNESLEMGEGERRRHRCVGIIDGIPAAFVSQKARAKQRFDRAPSPR